MQSVRAVAGQWPRTTRSVISAHRPLSEITAGEIETQPVSVAVPLVFSDGSLYAIPTRMVETQFNQLTGARIRYNDDTWELTGDITIKQNGAVLEAEAHKPDRVRKSRGILRFQLQNPPASINPGNPGEFDIDIETTGGETILVLERSHASDRYAVKSLRYE